MRYELHTRQRDSDRREVSQHRTLEQAMAEARRYIAREGQLQQFTLALYDRQRKHDARRHDTDDQIVFRYGE